MNNKIKIVIVDDHAIFRAGLKQVFADEPDFIVLGEASTAEEALRLIESVGAIDVLLLDISLPDQNGFEVLKQVKLGHPQLPVLLLSTYPEDQYAVRGLRMGAAGYLTKDCPPDQLIAGIRKVVSGKRLISEAITEQLINEAGRPQDKPAHEALSARELEVFKYIAIGKTPNEMANSMNLSVKTIATYRSRVMEKMGMTKNNEIIFYAIDHHLI